MNRFQKKREGAACFILAGLLSFGLPAFAEPHRELSGPKDVHDPDIREFEPSNWSPDTRPYYEKNYEAKPDQFKPLSYATGVTLGLIPINGLGLIYTGHRVSGAILIGIEAALAIPLMVVGASSVVDPINDGGFGSLDTVVGQAMFYTGLTLFGITYATDAIMTPILIRSHNKKLRSVQTGVAPYFTMTPDGPRTGISIQF